MSSLLAPAVPRPLERADAGLAASILAAAFFDDPVARYLIPRDDRLERALRLYVDRVWQPHGGCVVDPAGRGVATWLPPGAWHLGPAAQLRLLPALARLSGTDLPRVLAGLTAMETGHPTAPHWYLPMVGVVPEAQGLGLGSALLAARLRTCDAHGLPAYLEATTERSAALYERHGFRVVREGRMPRGGPAFWPMWRDPAA